MTDNTAAVPPREDIAIVGMAARFPGARNVEAFWRNLRLGIESVRSFTPDELAASAVDVRVLGDPDYVNAGAVLDDPEWFASSFFGYTPRESELIDPQQRVLLECAWEALEDAGYDQERSPGAVSVYAGIALNTYFQNNLLTHPELKPLLGQFQMTLGNEKDFVATRVAYKLNLRGGTFTVQTGCSTSLVATHLACQTLLAGECDLAIVGGGRIRVPVKAGYHYIEGGVPSSDGHCRAFDASANGCVHGSGMAVVVMKRLSEAIRDGDVIHAVIRGSAINNDGSDKIGFTAPSVSGQAAVISQALAMAGVSADSIGYVEAHGTGTSLGDPIEVAALTQAYRHHTQRRGYCRIGSVKTNIGHLDAGAGIAGLIKAVLAVKHGEIPASLNFRTPNPQIDFATSPFTVASDLAEWPSDDAPRRAGVSSFGIGGTNAHVILEQAPDPLASSPVRTSQLIVLSAKSDEALDQATANLAAALRRGSHLNLADVAFTLQAGRTAFPHRRALVGRTTAEVAALLDSGDAQRVHTATTVHDDPPVVFLFPGGGSQFPGMGRDLLETHCRYREVLNQCLECARDLLGLDLRELLFPADPTTTEAARRLERPRFSLPALFATELALAHQLMALGIRPTAMIGHSMGEYVAACLAGVFSPEQGVALVAKRGELFETLPEGGMLTVPLAETDLLPWLGSDLSIGAINAPSLCMVSGRVDAIADLNQRLAAHGIECTRIHIPVAAHSAMLDPILGDLEQFCRTISFQPPTTPFVSNLTGTWIKSNEATDPGYWVSHLRHTVRFADGMAELLSASDRLFLEVGPGRTLAGLARQQSIKTQQAWTSMRHSQDPEPDGYYLLQAIGRLWTAGKRVDWNALHSPDRRQRVTLPTYPFERKRHWIDPITLTRPLSPSASVEELPRPVPPGRPLETSTAPTAPAPGARADRLVAAIKQLLHEMSGVDSASLNEQATFLELGFESLFLTQANAAFHKTFKVRTTFRQLFEQTPTIAALAAFMDEQMPPDAFPEPATPRALPTASPGSSAPAGAVTLEVLSEQLQAIARQLQALQEQGGRGLPPLEIPPRPSLGSGTQVLAPAERAIGPWKPVELAASSALTEKQRRHVARLVERYCRKTAGSKRLAQEQRLHLADPRSVSGFRAVWKEMVYQIAVTHSLGSRLWDVDGNEFIDVTMGFSVNLFGFSPDFVTEAIEQQLKRGIEIGVLAPIARDVADAICEMTGVDRVCFVNTGSEANMAAIRAARTVTGRERIAVFAGAYHGIFDEGLVKPITVKGQRRSVPAAPGIPASMLEHVTVLDYGDSQSIDFLRREGHQFAAVLVEPIQTRHPDLQPKAFLHALRSVTVETGAALVFDEVVTGFRLHPRGAQGWFEVDADLVSYGKLIGGGMPMAVVAGKARFMDAFDGGTWRFGDDSIPGVGVTFFGGTFVKHPLALAASAAVLQRLKAEGPQLQQDLNRRADAFVAELNRFFVEQNLPAHLEHGGSICSLTFPGADEHARLLFFHLRDRGIHIYDRPFSISTAHSDQDLARIIAAVRDSVQEMREDGFLVPRGDGSRVGGPIVSTADRPRELVGTAALHGDGVGVALTESQLEVWLACQFGPASSIIFNETSLVQLRGPLDPDALVRAMGHVVGRHEALRTTFSADGRHQYVGPSLTLDIPRVDLWGLEAAAHEAGRDAILRAEAETPFDLVQGPLVRGRLVRHAANDHELVLTCHHLVCDGVSFGVVLEDLARFYTAESRGESLTLGPATAFREFAAWKAEQTGLEGHDEDRAYWLGQFSGDLPVLDLPGDRPRPLTWGHSGALESVEVDLPLVRALRQLAHHNGTTLFCLLLASFRTLLEYLSGQDDIVIGIPASGQSQIGSDSLVGHCVNFLPLRIPSRPTLLAALQAARGRMLDAFDHQNFTFAQLLRMVKLPRDPGRPPLVSVLFNLDPKPRPLRFGTIETFERSARKRHVNFDLQLNAVEAEQGLRLDCSYLSEVYDADTIRRWLGYYTNLLQVMASGLDQDVAQLSLISSEERRALLGDWHHVPGAGGGVEARGFPEPNQASLPRTIVGEFERQTRAEPKAIAVVSGDRCVSYQDLNRRANQIARRLRSYGVGPDVLVALFVERSPEMIAGILGILKAGGAYVPIDPSYPAARIEVILRDSGALVVVSERTLAARLPDVGAAILQLDADEAEISAELSDDLPPTVEGHHLAYVLFTSGSTGRPKGVAIEHRATMNFVTWARKVFAKTDLAGVLFSTSVCFDLSVFEMFVPLAAGGAVIVIPNALALTTFPSRDLVTLINTVPSVMAELLRIGAVPASVRTVNLAGEALPGSLVDEVYSKTQATRVYNLYGPTETTTYSTYTLVPRGGPVTIGRPISQTQAYVLDSRGQLAPIGVGGELYLAGAGLARGYHGRPDLTDERFVANPFDGAPGARMYRTGDRCRWLADGTLEYLGRLDHQVKVRGLRIELGEIETVLARHPAVHHCAVVAREDTPGSPRLVAYLESATSPAPADGELRTFLARTLPEYMVPSAFIVLPALPQTPTGKIDRKALPAFAEPERFRGEFVEPTTATERVLAGIWREVLGIDRIGLRSHFFELGGHSLLAIRLAQRVSEVVEVPLGPGALFEYPVLSALAGHIDLVVSGEPSDQQQVLVQIEKGGAGTPLFWVHGVGGEVFSYMPLSRHLGPSRPVYGFTADWSRLTPGRSPTLEEMAASYVKELRLHFPAGPYHLGGHCLGAMLALEMARQLEAGGGRVGVLAILGYDVTPQQVARLRQPFAFLRNLPLWLKDDAIPSGSSELLARVRSAFGRLATRSRSFLSHREGVDVDLREQLGMWRFPAYQLPMLKAHHDALRGYEPKPFKGTLRLFLPRTAPLFGPWAAGAAQGRGWAQLARGGSQVHLVRGSHSTMLKDPFAEDVAAILDASLDAIDGPEVDPRNTLAKMPRPSRPAVAVSSM